MRLKLFSTIAAAASLVAAPVMAQATSASKLSVARTSAAVNGEDLGEGSGGIVAIALIAGIVAIGVFAAIESGDDDDDSVSN